MNQTVAATTECAQVASLVVPTVFVEVMRHDTTRPAAHRAGRGVDQLPVVPGQVAILVHPVAVTGATDLQPLEFVPADGTAALSYAREHDAAHGARLRRTATTPVRVGRASFVFRSETLGRRTPTPNTTTMRRAVLPLRLVTHLADIALEDRTTHHARELHHGCTTRTRPCGTTKIGHEVIVWPS